MRFCRRLVLFVTLSVFVTYFMVRAPHAFSQSLLDCLSSGTASSVASATRTSNLPGLQVQVTDRTESCVLGNTIDVVPGIYTEFT
jgi:hypothetical protein